MNINIPVDYMLLSDSYVATTSGAIDRTLWTVPTAQVWVMSVGGVNRGIAANGLMHLGINDGIYTVQVLSSVASTNWEFLTVSNRVILGPGWAIRGRFEGVTVGETIQTKAIVYRIH